MSSDQLSRDFSGFDDWVPIFAGGKQIDSCGREHNGDELIDKAVQTFDPEYHEPPITVGHPRDNSPAFGWVSALKKGVQRLKDGRLINVLLAKFRDVVPEFAQAVRQGLYKKRSASFYPDGRLRHVGFLGGMPPAVKGLADLKFAEGEYSLFFSDSLAPSARGEEETEKEEGAGAVITNRAINLTASQQQKEDGAMTYSEEQMKALLDQEREQLRTEFEEKLKASLLEFSERLNQVADEAAKKIDEAREQGRRDAAREFAEARQREKMAARRQQIKEFISQQLAAGKLLPAWERMGLAQFMEQLDAEREFSFAEGKNESPYQWFCSFLQELPRVVNFSEWATRAKNVAASGSAGQVLSDLIAAKMKSNPRLDYSLAFSEVQRENPDLVREYEQEIRLGRGL